MKKQEKNIAEKYLGQKYNTIPEIILFIIAGLGVISYFAYSKFLAVPLIAVPALILIFVKTSKIKDAEYEEIIDRVLLENEIKRKGENILSAYDFTVSPIGIGMDKKARTPVCSVAHFSFSADKCKVNLYRVNAITRDLSAAEYEIPLPAGCERQSRTVDTPDGQRRADFLSFSAAPTLFIPVEKLSYDVEIIMNRLNGK